MHSRIEKLEAARAAEQLDQIFLGLKNAIPLLEQGRRHGIKIGLSDDAKKLIASRHGNTEEVSRILANTTTIPA